MEPGFELDAWEGIADAGLVGGEVGHVVARGGDDVLDKVGVGWGVGAEQGGWAGDGLLLVANGQVDLVNVAVEAFLA